VQTAQDLAADVFKRLLQALHRGQSPEREIRAWLYRTAHNLVIDHYRRQQHRQHLPLYEGVASGEGGPEQTAEVRVQAKILRAAIQELTPDQQQVITLKFLEGFKNKEIATVLNKPVGAVKSLQHRALAALQRQLSPIREEESI
jgi:RNA polymerase sigma-70 factor (ECF subfamily)